MPQKGLLSKIEVFSLRKKNSSFLYSLTVVLVLLPAAMETLFSPRETLL